MKMTILIILLTVVTSVSLPAEELTVVIDEQDVVALGGWPLNRKWYAGALQNLINGNARRIILDVAFPEANPTQPEADELLSVLFSQNANIFLLSNQAVLGSSDSLNVLGNLRLPASRFIIPFSAYIQLDGNNLLVDGNIRYSYLRLMLKDKLSTPQFVIQLPQQIIPANFHFAEIIQQPVDCQNKDIFIYTDYSGVSSYIVHENISAHFSTSNLQNYALHQIRQGNYTQAFSQPVLGLVFLLTLLPLALLRRAKNQVWGVGLSLFLMFPVEIILIILKIQHTFWFHFIALVPLTTMGWAFFRKSRRRLEKSNIPNHPFPVAASNPSDESEIRHLKNKLQFYEHLTHQKEPARAIKLPDYLQVHPHSPMIGILEKIGQVAETEIPVLIVGESGTGKEQLVKFLHEKSPRCQKPLVAVHCASFNQNLIESELFGHEAGAFTGATKSKKGKFDLADGGTLFLDEICETSLAVQVKLLRMLQEKVFERVGGISSIRTSARIVAATNRNPLEAIKQGIFREDFYYRLNGYSITIPPLRERKMDIEHLFRHFLFTDAPQLQISDSIITWMKMQTWPGNVRELKAATKRAILNAKMQNRFFLLPEDFEINNEIKDNSQNDLHIKIINELRKDGFRHRGISNVATALGLHRSTVTEYLRGWIIRYMQLSNSETEAVISAVMADANLENPDQFRNRIQSYTDKIRKNIASGLESRLSESGIRRSWFKNIPLEFENDVIALIRQYTEK